MSRYTPYLQIIEQTRKSPDYMPFFSEICVILRSLWIDGFLPLSNSCPFSGGRKSQARIEDFTAC